MKSKIPSARFKHQDYLAHALSVCHHDGARDAKANQLHDDYTHITSSAVYAPLISDANEILDFLEGVNDAVGRQITQKWIFVDLFYFLYKNKNVLRSTNPKDFSKAYLAFEDARKKHNAEPEKLLTGKSTKADKDLYDYIIAFKIGGGERSNIMQRAAVVSDFIKSFQGKR